MKSYFVLFIGVWFILQVSGCVMRDKWITVDCRVYEWIMSDEIRNTQLFYGIDSLVMGDSLVPVESAFILIYIEGDLEKLVEEDPGSMGIRTFTDSTGFLHDFGAAPAGIYDIGIVIGKEGYISATIIVEDPPDPSHKHVVSVILAEE